MKANKAPEKLYLIQHNGLICYCRNNDDDIEYTQKDAFIKKAEEYLSKHQCEYIDFDDFRKTMKGKSYGTIHR